MNSIERWVRFIGRFAVGVGTVLALICAGVIVMTDIGPGAESIEVVRLDPVVVTISTDRYDAIRAELHGRTAIVRTRGGLVDEG